MAKIIFELIKPIDLGKISANGNADCKCDACICYLKKDNASSTSKTKKEV